MTAACTGDDAVFTAMELVLTVCLLQANGAGNGNGAAANGNGARSGNGSGSSPLPEEDSTGVRRLLKLLKVDSASDFIWVKTYAPAQELVLSF